MVGRTLAHYNILARIGSGGMGEVYLGTRHEAEPRDCPQGSARRDGREPRASHAFRLGEHYLYFTWENSVGDIWVMDVVTDKDEWSGALRTP